MDQVEVKVFISSPGDVAAERARAGFVIDRLNAEMEGRVRLTPVLWEEEFYTADRTFQDQIPKPSQTDLVVCVLWKRLGSDLPPEYSRTDGIPRTGTEFEFEDALESALNKEVPDILVYRKTAKVTFDADSVEREQSNLRALEAFWQKWFHNEQGHFTAAFHKFDTTDRFEADFEKHLRQWLERRGGEVVWPLDLKGSPFRGLESFEEEHAPVFFGRRRAIEQVRARLTASALRGCAFLLVLGMSGSGKSSLIKAGVVPRLMRPGAVTQVDRWRGCVVRPSQLAPEPIQGLAEALFQEAALPELAQGDARTPTELADVFRESPKNSARSLARALERWADKVKSEEHFERDLETRLLLVVDQFEEIFALPEDELTRFIAIISTLAKSGQVWVVSTMRSDFYPAFQARPDLLALKEAGGTYDLPAPGQAELREIIQGPAKAAGLGYEQDPAGGESLSDLLEQAAAQPGSLPLLEFTLEELFKLRASDANTMLLSVYQALGGLEGAIERRAEDIFQAQPEAVQAELPGLLRSLTTVDEAGAITARTVDLSDAAVNPSRNTLIEAFVEARLLISGGGESGQTIRVAHEALCTHWSRAKDQIASDREALQIRSRINTAAAHWQKENRRPDLLLPDGKPLVEANHLLEIFADDLDEKEITFINASQAKARTRQRIKQAAVAALVLLTVLAGVLAFWANTQRQEAETQRQAAKTQKIEADRQRTEAEQRKIEADKQRVQAEQSRVRAEQALKGAEVERSKAISLLRSIENNETVNVVVRPALAEFYSRRARTADENRDWSAAAIYSRTSLLRVDASATRFSAANSEENLCEEIGFLGLPGGVRFVTFSPQGRLLASAGSDETVRLWDVAMQKEVAVLKGYEGWINVCSFSSDGRLLVTSSQDGAVRLWDVAKQKEVAVLKGYKGRIKAVSFSSAGQLLASAGTDNTVRLWDVTKQKEVAVLKGHEGTVRSVFFSPDGRFLVSTSWDKTARLWDIAKQMEVAVLKGHAGWVHSVSFSPDGRLMATTPYDDNTIRLWDVAGKKELTVLRGHKYFVYSVSFSPDGRLLASVSQDGTARLWDLAGKREVAVLKGHAGWVKSVSFSPNGGLLATADENTVRLWDVAGIKKAAVLTGHEGSVLSIAISPDGRLLASAGSDKTVRLWDVAKQKEVAVLTGHEDTVRSVFFSPDGQLLASAGMDGNIRLWDVAKQKEVAVLTGHEGSVLSIAISPDGRLLASAGSDKTVRLWDVAIQKEVAVLKGHEDTVRSVFFSPDGRLLASASWDVLLWDIAKQKEAAVLTGHDGWINFIRFSPDGRLLASVGIDGNIRLWDVAKQKEAAVLKGHEDSGNSVSFSPDGRLLASAGSDKTVRLWDIAKQMEVAVLKGHRDWISSVSFSPDGRLLASAGKEIRLWPIPGCSFLTEDLDSLLIRLASLTAYAISYDLNDNGKPLYRGPAVMALARLEGAEKGRLHWIPDGGRAMVPAYRNVVESTWLMHLAAQKGDLDGLKLLLERGANPDMVDDTNRTPLMAAASQGEKEVCRLLIDAGAKVNATDNNGETALMRAARAASEKRKGVYDLLLAAGADPKIKNKKGRTAADILKKSTTGSF